jgi:hypothetical protein
VDGPSVLSLASSIVVNTNHRIEPVTTLFLIYRKAGGGPWRLVIANPVRTFDDIGWTAQEPGSWPAAPPTRPINQDWWSTVRSITGLNIMLADKVPASVSGATVMHDDTQAIQAAIDAGAAAGRVVKLGAHTYPVNLAGVYSPIGLYIHSFTRSTSSYVGVGLLQLHSNSHLEGSGRGATILFTDFIGHESGVTGTFGLNIGHRANPFFLRGASTCRLNPAAIGVRMVTTLSPPGRRPLFGGRLRHDLRRPDSGASVRFQRTDTGYQSRSRYRRDRHRGRS